MSPRIGMCIVLKYLYIKRCSHIPSEISNCQSLKRLILQRCTDQIDLPQGITLYGLKNVLITGGTWNEERTWLASSAPNLEKFCVSDQTIETANLFMDGLSRNNSFIDKFKDNLECLGIGSCNLIEEDAKRIIFNIRPLYPGLAKPCLYDNCIRSLQNIGTVAKELTINGPISSNLQCLYIDNSPVSSNLISLETTDYAAMVCLIKTFQRLHQIRFKADTIRGHTIFAFSSTIKYWTMINEGGRFLVDGGTSGDNNEQQQQQISLDLWSNVLERAYNRKKNATPMFYLLRHWLPHFLSSLSSSPSFKIKTTRSSTNSNGINN